MCLTDDMDRLKKYAIEHEENIFFDIDHEVLSYWEEEEESALLEYMFDTPVELISLLKEYITDDVLINLMVAAVYKKKDSYAKIKDENTTDMTLPDYVYNF